MESVAAMAMAASDAAAMQVPDATAAVMTLKLHMVDEEMFRASTGRKRARGRGRGRKAAKLGGELEFAMWSLLPWSILECVLLKLPPRSIARFKAVSRAWRQMLSAPAFLRKMEPAHFLASVFDLGQKQQHRLGSVQWFCEHRPDEAASLPGVADEELGLPHHLLRIDERLPIPPRFQQWEQSGTQVRTQRGLICVAVQAWRPHRLCVCLINPVNRTWRVLPELPWPEQECKAEVFLQVLNEGAAVFKVFVASVCCGRFLNGHPGTTTMSVYSSDGARSGSWTTVPHPCYPWPAGCDDRIRHVASGDKVYVLLLEAEGVGVLSAEDGRELRRVSLAPLRGPPGPGRDVQMSGRVQLADYRGKLVAVTFDCVGPCYTRQKPSSFSVTIWMLHGDGANGDGDEREESRWEKLTVMPGELLVYTRAATSGAAAPARVEVGNGKMDFFLHNLRQVQVVGDVVFINLTAFRSHTSVVAYHLRRRAWKVVLRDAVVHDRPRVFQVLQSRPALDLSSSVQQ